MKKPIRNKPDYFYDRQGTRWERNYFYHCWNGTDNFGGIYFKKENLKFLTGIWDQ